MQKLEFILTLFDQAYLSVMCFLPQAVAAAALAAQDGVIFSGDVPVSSHTRLIHLLVLVIKSTLPLSLLSLSSCRDTEEMGLLTEHTKSRQDRPMYTLRKNKVITTYKSPFKTSQATWQPTLCLLYTVCIPIF